MKYVQPTVYMLLYPIMAEQLYLMQNMQHKKITPV